MHEPVYTVVAQQVEYAQPRIHRTRYWFRKGSRILADIEWYGNVMSLPKFYDRKGRRERDRDIPEAVRKEYGSHTYILLREAFGEEAAVRFSVVFAVQLRVMGVQRSREGDWKDEIRRVSHSELLAAVIEGTRKTA